MGKYPLFGRFLLRGNSNGQPSVSWASPLSFLQKLSSRSFLDLFLLGIYLTRAYIHGTGYLVPTFFFMKVDTSMYEILAIVWCCRFCIMHHRPGLLNCTLLDREISSDYTGHLYTKCVTTMLYHWLLPRSSCLRFGTAIRRSFSTNSTAEAFLHPVPSHPSVACLFLNRPQSKNAISMRMLRVSAHHLPT